MLIHRYTVMVFTHVLVGALMGALAGALLSTPDTMLVIIGALAGGLPDIDMAWRHRRSLHFPILGSVIAVLALVVAFFTPSIFVVYCVVFATAFALHSIMDIFGGGKELRPWAQTDDRAVYDHVRQRWIMARRFVYDGSPGDLVICAMVGITLSLHLPSKFGDAIGILILLGSAYAIVRREITRRIPPDVETYESWIQDVVR